jgi:hypothetical protein
VRNIGPASCEGHTCRQGKLALGESEEKVTAWAALGENFALGKVEKKAEQRNACPAAVV